MPTICTLFGVRAHCLPSLSDGIYAHVKEAGGFFTLQKSPPVEEGEEEEDEGEGEEESNSPLSRHPFFQRTLTTPKREEKRGKVDS